MSSFPRDPNLYQAEICREYGFDPQGYRRFLQDYAVLQRDELLPDDPHQAMEGEFGEIAASFGLTKVALRRLQQASVVGWPLTGQDAQFLQRLQRLWGKAWFLRAQMARMSASNRARLFERPELVSSWERWAYRRILLAEVSYGDGGRMLNPEDRAKLVDMLSFIQDVYGVPATDKVRARLRQIRRMAYSDRKKAQSGRLSLEALALTRGAPPEESP